MMVHGLDLNALQYRMLHFSCPEASRKNRLSYIGRAPLVSGLWAIYRAPSFDCAASCCIRCLIGMRRTYKQQEGQSL